MNARINTIATIITKNIYIDKPSTIPPGVILLAPKALFRQRDGNQVAEAIASTNLVWKRSSIRNN